MSSLRSQAKINSLIAALLLPSAAVAQTQIPATGLCNTGLTAANPLPIGCAASTPVTPVNPQSGGSTVDGNWQLATPYPSASYTAEAPDPCSLTTFGPAWVDQPDSDWVPNDSVSQFIMPDAVTSPAGWYVYRTAIPVPAAEPGATYYILNVAGRILVDDFAIGIFFNDSAAAAGCKTVALPPPASSGWTSWHPIKFSAPVTPGTIAHLYFVDFNNGTTPNPTALRAEFTSASFIPR